jgi:hypothetical protein
MNNKERQMNRWMRLSAAVGALAIVVLGGYYAAQACDGSKSKTGVQKASAGGDCTWMKAQGSGSCTGTMQKASAGTSDCAKMCGAHAQASLSTTKGLSTIQVVETTDGFRVYTVGSKEDGQTFLKKSAAVLEAQQVKSHIHEAADGVFLDVEGTAAKQMLHKWQEQAKNGQSGCLLVTKEGECLFDAEMLAPVAG